MTKLDVVIRVFCGSDPLDWRIVFNGFPESNYQSYSGGTAEGTGVEAAASLHIEREVWAGLILGRRGVEDRFAAIAVNGRKAAERGCFGAGNLNWDSLDIETKCECAFAQEVGVPLDLEPQVQIVGIFGDLLLAEGIVGSSSLNVTIGSCSSEAVVPTVALN